MLGGVTKNMLLIHEHERYELRIFDVEINMKFRIYYVELSDTHIYYLHTVKMIVQSQTCDALIILSIIIDFDCRSCLVSERKVVEDYYMPT